MEQQLKFKVTYGFSGDSAQSQEVIEVFAFDIIQAIEFADQMRAQSQNKITKVEQCR